MTLNNIVIAVAFFIAASWAWGSVQAMQRNFGLQRNLDAKNRELTLLRLQNDTLSFQNDYYSSDEYRKLAARERLGLADSGERVLVLPPNTQAAKDADTKLAGQQRDAVVAERQVSNVQQWVNFLFGGNRQSLQTDD